MIALNTLLKINDITKAYNGKLALNNISFDINKSEILGVLGPNGAGKSTLFNILSGVVSADKGSILFNDKDCAKKKIYKNALGIVPQDISLYGNMTVNENLKFIGKLYSVRGKLLSERIDELITQIISMSSIGLLVSIISKTRIFSIGLSFFIIMVFSPLGGLWFPLNTVPEFLVNIASALPSGAYMLAIEKIIINDAGFLDIVPNLAVIMVYFIITFLLCIRIGFMGNRKTKAKMIENPSK